MQRGNYWGESILDSSIHIYMIFLYGSRTFAIGNNRTKDEVGVSRCWGYDSDGQTSKQPGNTLFFALSSGGYHTCGIKAGESCQSVDIVVFVCSITLLPYVIYCICTLGKTFDSADDGVVQCWLVIQENRMRNILFPHMLCYDIL